MVEMPKAKTYLMGMVTLPVGRLLNKMQKNLVANLEMCCLQDDRTAPDEAMSWLEWGLCSECKKDLDTLGPLFSIPVMAVYNEYTVYCNRLKESRREVR